jgi:outer membrane autotransporter protein
MTAHQNRHACLTGKSNKTFKPRLLTCAVAVAIGSLVQPALAAVDLCDPSGPFTISSANPGGVCALETAGDSLTVTSAGSLGRVTVSVPGVAVSNAGTVSGDAPALEYTTGLDTTLTNLKSGTIKNAGTGLDLTTAVSGFAAGVKVDGDVTGNITNSGTISGVLKAVGAHGTSSTYRTTTTHTSTSGHSTPTGGGGSTWTTTSSWTTTYSTTVTERTAAQVNVVGMALNGNANATITNSGTISADLQDVVLDVATAHVRGIEIDGDLSGTLNNTGTISASMESVTLEHHAQANVTGIYVGGDLSGALNNSGTISASIDGIWGSNDGGSAVAVGVYVEGDLSGTVTNSGTVSASIKSTESSTAYSHLKLLVGGIGVDGDTTGSILNTGKIMLTVGAVAAAVSGTGIHTDLLTAGGSIQNKGLIEMALSAASGQATGYGIRSGDLNTAQITNSGTIQIHAEADDYAQATGIRAYDLTNANITNSGTINLKAVSVDSSGSAIGIQTDDLNGTSQILNSGVIKAEGEHDSPDVTGIVAGELNDSANITNSGTLQITATSTNDEPSAEGIEVESMNGSASIINSGTLQIRATASSGPSAQATGIHVDGSLNDVASILNSGAINVQVVAAGDGDDTDTNAYGMRVEDMNDGASLTNAGTLFVSARIEGSHHDIYPRAVGISADRLSGTSASALAQITNTGTITVNAHADSAYSDANVEAYGMVTGDLLDFSQITNSGALVVNASLGGTLEDSSVKAYGIQTDDVNGSNAHLTNNNTIQVNASAGRLLDLPVGSLAVSAFGISVGDMTNGATITNNGSILVDASAPDENGDANAIGIHAETLDATAKITNNGTIFATAEGGDVEAFAIQVDGGTGGNVTNYSHGVMLGGVSLQGANQSFTNYGSITTWNGGRSHVSGDFTNEQGGKLAFELGGTGDYGLQVNGTATFSDAVTPINILVAPKNDLGDGSSFDVIQAGSLSFADSSCVTSQGCFKLTDSSLFWNFTGDVDGSDYYVTSHYLGAAQGLADAGVHASPSVAAFLDDLLTNGYDPNSPLAPLYEGLSGSTSVAGLSNVLSSMSPALFGAAGQATREVAEEILNVISQRQAQTRGASSGDTYTDKSLWIKPYYGLARQDSQGATDGYQVDSNGFVLGMDGATSDNLRLGAALAVGSSDAKADNSDLDIDSTHVMVYGTWALGSATSLDARVDYGMHDYKGSRDVTVTGDVAKADYDGNQWLASLDLNHTYHWGSKWTFTPGLGVTWTRVGIDGYTETGAGAFDLTTGDSVDRSLRTSLHTDFVRKLSDKSAFTSTLQAAYDNADQASVGTTLAGGGGPYVINGIDQGNMVYDAGVGYRYTTGANMEISASYNLELRDDYNANQFSVKVRMPF